MRLTLAFLIPFGLGLACITYPSGSVAAGTVCGVLLGAVFLGCYSLASTRATSGLGQALGGFILFLGFAAVVLGVLFAGCGFLLR